MAQRNCLGQTGSSMCRQQGPDLFLTPQSVGWMEDAIYLKSNAFPTSDMSVSFYRLALHSKKNGRELPSMSRPLTRACWSEKKKGGRFFSSSRTGPTHTVQPALVQTPVHGTGAEYRERFYAWFIDSCISDMLHGFTLTTFFFSFPNQQHTYNSHLQVILLWIIGVSLSWKKLEFDSCIEWNGWSIQPALMIARLPSFKLQKVTALIDTLSQKPCRKNLEKIIGIILWATSLVHHTRFLLTSLRKDLYAIPATNLQHSTNSMGIFLECTQWRCHHLYPQQSPSPDGCTYCWVQTYKHYFQAPITYWHPHWVSRLGPYPRSQHRQTKSLRGI